jgi:hypothetical protein
MSGGIIVAIAGATFYPTTGAREIESGGSIYHYFNTTTPCDLHAYGGHAGYILTTAASDTDACDMYLRYYEGGFEDPSYGIGMSFAPGAAAASPVWW